MWRECGDEKSLLLRYLTVQRAKGFSWHTPLPRTAGETMMMIRAAFGKEKRRVARTCIGPSYSYQKKVIAAWARLAIGVVGHDTARVELSNYE